MFAAEPPERRYSETNGVKARENWDRVLADSRAKNRAIAGQCCGEPSNGTSAGRPLPCCPSP